MEYLNASDKKYTKKLIKAIVDSGCYVSVYNGECYEEYEDHPEGRTAKLTQNIEQIHSSIGSTEEDIIRAHVLKEEGFDTKGAFHLIYNNGFDMEDGIGVICDHTDNEYSREIYNKIDDC